MTRPPESRPAAVATRVYLMRHGAVLGAEARRFIGHLDVPLSPAGQAQCQAVAGRLAKLDVCAIYASDLDRTRRSAEIVGLPAGRAPILVPALREMSMGRWEGLTAEEIRARDPAEFARWMAGVGHYQIPDGESVLDLARRAWPAFEGMVSGHPGQTIAVVAHGGTNRALLCRALSVPFERLLAFGQDYAALTVLELAEGRWSLRRLNESPSMS